jgi:signal peptidase I
MKRWITTAAVLALAAIVVARFVLFGLSVIPQNGMFPTLPAGSHVVTYRYAYRNLQDVRRGDIVVYRQIIGGVNYKLIWRAVGLPGDRVEVRSGRLWINRTPATYVEAARDHIYRESIGGRAYDIAIQPGETSPDVSVVVPAGAIFTLGDNRNAAVDSRFRGSVPFPAIEGKAVFWW